MILVTGCLGFIGSHLICDLTTIENQFVVGIDKVTTDSCSRIQKQRLNHLNSKLADQKKNHLFIYKKIDLCSEKQKLDELFNKYKIKKVVHLAVSTGVIESTKKSDHYIKNNINGFQNIIEKCKDYKIEHFFYASSSSIYDENNVNSFSCESDASDYPKSIYAFTKKTNELLAYTYSHLYNLNTTGLRFFSVYGPFGREDMSYYKFTSAILNSEKIYLYNRGENLRDFTYIKDVTSAIIKLLFTESKKNKVFNIGYGKQIKITQLLEKLEILINKKANITYLPALKEESFKTGANNRKIRKEMKIEFSTSIDVGLKKFVDWYSKYYNGTF
tara:strand:- start:627 stop:1616 length:990 start_codon:yes stop_codon:yes gene_type:complete